VNYINSLFACIIYVYIAVIISVNVVPEARRTTVIISYSLGMICVVVFDYVLKYALFNCMHMVWHSICLTCSSWNYVYDVVCMIIL
jgi:hypothetical protein